MIVPENHVIFGDAFLPQAQLNKKLERDREKRVNKLNKKVDAHDIVGFRRSKRDGDKLNTHGQKSFVGKIGSII